MSALEIALGVLEKLGLAKETLDIFKDETKVKDLKPEDLTAEIVGIQREVLEQDETFVGEIESRTRKTLLGKRQELLSRLFGEFITKEEIEALPERDRFDAALKLLQKKVKDAKSGGGNPDDKDKKIEELSAALEKLEGENKRLLEEEIPGVQRQWEEKMTARELSSHIRSTFDKSLGGKLVADPDLLYPGISTSLLEKYDAKLEGGAVVLYEKGKTTKALRNSKPLALNTALEELAEEKKAIKKSEDPPAKPKLKEGEGGGKKVYVAGRAKAEQAIAEAEASKK
jgi:hypothetical protein